MPIDTTYVETINDFISLNVYKSGFNWSKGKNELRNLLYWCVATDKSIAWNCSSKANSYLIRLSDDERYSLCLGYLRNGGYEYPDSIATII